MHALALPLPVIPRTEASEIVSKPSPEVTPAAPAMDPEDARIILAIRRGEPRAAAQLYRRLAPAVSRTLRRLLRNSEAERDDIMQVTFERIITTLVDGSYRGACGLRRWAVAIATHAAIDHQRARGRERKILQREPQLYAEVERVPGRDAERSIIARSELQSLQSTLGRMRPGDAQVLLLCHGLGHSLAEAAAMMGKSEAATASRLARARRELLRRLGQVE
jgi:RNA polymerase sigma-70 factor (ECF subfamily)